MPDLPPRRSTDTEILLKLAELTTLMQNHLEEEKLLRPRLEELLILLERSKGVLYFLKLCIFLGAPVGAAVYWIKDHIKL